MKELITEIKSLITQELKNLTKTAQNRRASIEELTNNLTAKITDDSNTCYSKEIVRVATDLHQICSNIRFFTHIADSIAQIEKYQSKHQDGSLNMADLKYLHRDVKRYFHCFEPCSTKYDLIVDCIISHY